MSTFAVCPGRLLRCVTLTLFAAAALAGAESPWVQPTPDGRLAYRADERGNTIPDFSRAGYGGGGVRLPELPVVLALDPAPTGDDGARIQSALDAVARRPVDARGHRGAVLLRRGVFRVEGSLAITTGGIVLRGEGNGEDGTVILATGRKQRTLVNLGTPGARRREIEGSRRAVTDRYVPWSSARVTVESVDGLRVGDRIVLHRPATAEWIHALGMDRIKPRAGDPDSTKQWKPGGQDLYFERTIIAIEGRQLTFDAPVMNAIEAAYGGASIFRATFERMAEAGVENLRLVSEYEKGRETSDEAHAWIGIAFGAVENAWARGVTVVHFSHAVEAGGASLFTTTQDCAHLDPVSQITGGRRYSFSLNGQYGLVLRCHARGARHTFVTGARVAGPNVFLDGTAVQSHADSGPHHRWAAGTLYDNISDDNQLRVQDRQWAGSGHGWAGAQQVLWNCTSPTIVVQQPPTAQNYAIGCVGRFVAGDWSTSAARGIVASPGAPVQPRSLYRAQLEQRLGPAALAAVEQAPGAARPSTISP